MKILVIGQCTLHWGRMEYGNIGNYYIIEPFVRELHKVFPNAEIKTTFQMSDEFCVRENINKVSMDLYYGWNENDLDIALEELASAEIYNKTGILPKETPFIREVRNSDLIIDFSGDIWGDNADFLGSNRFLIGLCKDRVAQLLGKPTVMLAGSPGPFENQQIKAFAKEVYANFDLVTNRENISIELLKENGFDVSKTKSLSCPAFLFNPADNMDFSTILDREGIRCNGKPNVGFILCGWNFIEGPFDKEERGDSEFTLFAEAIEHLTEILNVNVLLMSHSNGFPIPPKPFELLHGRDYKIIKQLERVIHQRGIARDVYTMNNIYDAWTTKAIIGNFDMLVSGRVHAAVSGLSQSVPTVIIDYGHEPRAHKLKGFAEVCETDRYVANPTVENDLIDSIDSCWNSRDSYRKHLEKRIPRVKNMAAENFKLLKSLKK